MSYLPRDIGMGHDKLCERGGAKSARRQRYGNFRAGAYLCDNKKAESALRDEVRRIEHEGVARISQFAQSQ